MKFKYILSVCLFFLFISTAFTQNNVKIKELEKKRKEAIEQIASMNKLLSETKKSSKSSLRKLQLLASQIAERKRLVELLSSEISELENQTTALQSEVTRLGSELDVKKAEYGKSLQLMYQKRSAYDKVMFVFSAQSFNQAFRRARYLKEYAVWSRMKGEEIQGKQVVLNSKKDELEKTKTEKFTLLTIREKESKNLQTEEKKQKTEVTKLTQKQKELTSAIAKQKKQAAALDYQIQKIIQEEIRRAQEEARRQREAEERRKRLAEEARRKAEAEAAAREKAEKEERAEAERLAKQGTVVKPKTKKTPKVEVKPVEPEPEVQEPVIAERKAETQGGYAMTREEKSLSDDFANNRGSLPVPVAGRYILVSRYGTQQHGDLKHVVTNNNGVDLQTDPGTDARVVFKGVVSKVFAVPGFNSSVIIRHGNFLTVYSNLSRVYVGAGDRVSTRQSIGKIYSDPDEGNRTVLHFQVWKEMTKQNPQIWLNF